MSSPWIYSSNGNIIIANGHARICLLEDGKIKYEYMDTEKNVWSFNMLCEVGEIWKPLVIEALKKYKVKLGTIDSESDYHDCWISYTFKHKVYKQGD